MIVGPGTKTGMDIRIDNPAQLGADLLVGAVAAVAVRVPVYYMGSRDGNHRFCCGRRGPVPRRRHHGGGGGFFESLVSRASQLPVSVLKRRRL